MAKSVRDLIDPISLEYEQGRIAFLAGECYETCPHEAPKKGLSRERTNWFEGYWDARAEHNRRGISPKPVTGFRWGNKQGVVANVDTEPKRG